MHPPAQAAAAWDAAYDLAIHDAIDLLQKEAPLSDGTEQQRSNVITQDKYNLFRRALQELYRPGETDLIMRTLRRIMEVG